MRQLNYARRTAIKAVSTVEAAPLNALLRYGRRGVTKSPHGTYEVL